MLLLANLRQLAVRPSQRGRAGTFAKNLALGPSRDSTDLEPPDVGVRPTERCAPKSRVLIEGLDLVGLSSCGNFRARHWST